MIFLCHTTQGPFVKMDELLHLMETMELGSSPDSAVASSNGGGGEKTGVKRKRENGDDDELLRVPPVNDIYRSRQQKRVHA